MSLFKRIPWKILLLSLVITTILTFLFKDMFLPYNFVILESARDDNITRAYHDFDHDGFSECLEIHNIPNSRYFIYIRNWNGGTIDQTNYWEPIGAHSMLFADITGDGFDEIITFTQDEDSLFIYMHDIITKKPLINRHYILPCAAYRSATGRYARFYPACIADPSIYKQKVIIFAIRSSALGPRSVYAFDLENLCIVKQFITHSPFTGLQTYDLTGDGLDEIIISSAAWGNIHEPVQYRDDRCWLFVLDQKLNPVFPPLSFSEYPAELALYPIEVHTERYLLAVPDYHGEKNLNRFIYLIDPQGKVHLRTQNPFGNFINERQVANYRKNPTEIYGWQNDNQLIKLNHQLKITGQAKTGFSKFRTASIQDLNADNNEEILCTSQNFLSVFDNNLNLLSTFPTHGIKPNIIYRECGPGNPLEVGVQLKKDFTRLGYTANIMHTFLPLLFIGLTGTVFLLLLGTTKLIKVTAIYVQIFKHYFYDSSDGILIVNAQGKILYTNNQIHAVLNLPHAPLKGEFIASALNRYPEIIELLHKCYIEGQAIQETIFLKAKESKLETELSVRPFSFLSIHSFCYLLELNNPKSSSNSDKIQIWSRAVQKMAHDIKTPLSTVSLNLKALQTRLGNMQIPDTERQNLSGDINMMRSELDNIQAMTKNFLKFSNLEKPHMQAYDIKNIVDNAVNKYQVYFNSDQRCEVSIDDDVKPIWADPHQIEMVFHILIENSLAALRGKGLMKINISLAQFLDVSFSEFLEIEVTDTGPGIKNEDLKSVFEPYFTTKQSGTGMGLAIAKKIIEDHGGSIDVYSKSGFGAVFRFSVPVNQEEGENG